MYIVPKDIEKNSDLNSKLELLKNIKRSFSVFRIDCGGCNGCEIEIYAALSPLWDPERFGFKLVANPRHADILLVTGPITRQMYYPLLRAYEATPDPKIVVAFGACGASGGIFHDSYAVWGGADKVIPVDVFIPGCPPHPASIIYGLATGVGLIEQKMQKQSYKDDKPMPQIVQAPLLENSSFERDLLVKAKFLMSYIHGRILYDKFISAMKLASDPKDANLVKEQISKAINEQEDPRFGECLGILYNEIYLKYLSLASLEAINLDQISWDKK
ncbi:hydrogenase-4, component I [Campylobacter iguaniorum]|uniref:NADH-quinone oxidoreductase subunit B family protein n=1 Tax=Campylobacter iguaniorum TaxID=1244531 RepID=UPI00073A1AC9|nr:NADH-quinone oxidoreductase subunit B family protein [Campylobacter iguaniorum]ALV23755.1 hydrogenase-4, component I [Campylobacter iguaniorum]